MLRRAALAALEYDGPRDGEASFTFVSLREIRALNHDYLAREEVTDVIAFELGEEGRLLGDVYISPEVATMNAADRDESGEREILRLVVHGSLHLIGLDHPEGPDREASEMFVLQEELLRSLMDG
jgi:probable rRNA maturation factor